MAESEHMSYTVRIERDDDGSFVAEVLQLPGCFASAASIDELQEALEDSISLYLSTNDVRVTIEIGHTERALRVIKGDGEAEISADVDFALAR